MATPKIPVGPARGKLITECSVAELEAACDDVDARLCAAKSEQTTKKHKTFVGAARALLRFRKFPVGTYADAASANRALRDAKEAGHLLAPGDQVAAMLPGCALLLSAFTVNYRQETFEDEEHPGEFVPAKILLDRIANGLGVSWQAPLCKRTDDHKNANVRSYQAAGLIRDFDGSERGIQAQAGLDLSPDSATVGLIRSKFVKTGTVEVDRRRRHIDALCDTQARLRAVRTLGVKKAYTVAELGRPFFTARLVFTAETDDPGLKALFGEKIAANFLRGSDGLFGKRAVGDRR